MVLLARNFLFAIACVCVGFGAIHAQQSPQVIVGSTYYDFQSFRSLPTRLVYSPENNNVQLVWMAAEDGSDLQQIFSYYASFDVTELEPVQNNGWSAVETSRGLWGGIAEFEDGTIGVASHTPVKFSKNNFTDIGGFNTHSTNSPGSFFARTAAGEGSNVHLIYSSNPQEAILAYKRSDDAGATWSDATVLTGDNSVLGALPLPIGPDAYAFDANGSTVALVFVDSDRQVHAVTSVNGGDTWESQVVVAADFSSLKEIEDLGNDLVRFESTPQWLAGGDIDVQIDDAGTIHVVAQALYSTLRGVGERNGAINRTGADTLYSDADSLQTRGLMYINTQEKAIELFASPGGDNGWDGLGTFLPGERFASSLCAYPQLSLGNNGDIFVVFTAPKSGQTKTVSLTGSDVQASMGHVYSTLRTQDGTWQRQVDNSPNGKDCTYPAIARFADERVFIAYQQDEQPGVASGPGGTQLSGQTDIIVRGVARDAYRLDISVETDAAHKVRAYPIPASSEVTIDVVELGVFHGTADIRVYSIDGSVIASRNQQIADGKIQLQVSNFATGTYLARIKVGGATHECKFSVR